MGQSQSSRQAGEQADSDKAQLTEHSTTPENELSLPSIDAGPAFALSSWDSEGITVAANNQSLGATIDSTSGDLEAHPWTEDQTAEEQELVPDVSRLPKVSFQPPAPNKYVSRRTLIRIAIQLSEARCMTTISTVIIWTTIGTLTLVQWKRDNQSCRQYLPVPHRTWPNVSR